MRDLTIHELNDELAEQLPARELMGQYCRPSYHPSHPTYSVTQGGGYNGSGDGNFGFLSGNLDGNLSGNSVNIL